MAFIADHLRKTGLKQREPVNVDFVDGNDDDSDKNFTEDTGSSSEDSSFEKVNTVIDEDILCPFILKISQSLSSCN